MFKYVLTFLFLSLVCCTGSASTVAVNREAPLRNGELVERFSNDSAIGRAGENRVEIDVIKNDGEDATWRPNNTAVVRFFFMSASKEWQLKQTFEIEDHALAEMQAEVADFNNDGFKDITFVSNQAARGANEVRTLLIYDTVYDKLIHIRNSESYPNLYYNKTLDCIDSWMFHGATTTVFLRLEGDQLKEFASVNTGAELVVTVIDSDGKAREIRREKMNEEDVYTRYQNFDPPVPYSER